MRVFGAKTPNPSRQGLVSGMQFETTSEGDGGGVRAMVDVVDMVVCGCSMTQAGAVVGGQNRAVMVPFGVGTR